MNREQDRRDPQGGEHWQPARGAAPDRPQEAGLLPGPAGSQPHAQGRALLAEPVIDYLLDRYPSVVHARDHRGRTPLHYAAVLSDGGEIYKMLLDHGADLKATDVFGNRPEYYMHAQDEMDIQALKAGTDVGKPNMRSLRIKNLQPTGGGGQGDIIARSAKPVSTRMQIREMISSGNLEALEELVLQGHGDRLLGETATSPLVRDFIHMVPIYMERIYEIHRAVSRGRLRDADAAGPEEASLGPRPPGGHPSAQGRHVREQGSGGVHSHEFFLSVKMPRTWTVVHLCIMLRA
ncbi:tankyrase-1 [Caerostris extrusa]|uniref:Tankyrase-1 n=1 Tax=Caerostris extrusa TaxID=172846 RepID=A0AAV4SUL2_CAEEX|nr:tankyrase-1 [Caerostris extrusa]